MARWHDITRDPEYQDLSPEVKLEVKKGFFDRTIALDPDFQTLSQEGKEATFEEFMQTPDDTGQGYVSSMLGAAGRGFGEVVPGAIEGVGALTGLEGLRETGEELRSGLESISPVNPIYAESVPVKLAGVGGQIGSVVATAGTGGLAGKMLGGVGAVSKGAKAASLGSAFLQGAAEGAREAEQYGMTGPEAYLRTLAGGATEAGTELLPFGMAAETALAKRVLAGTPRTGTFLGATASEGAEESLAQIGSNIATKLLAPAGVETPDITAGALEAGLYGAAGGAMLGGVNALISTPPERQTQIQKDLQAEAGAIPKDTVPDQTNEEKLAAMEAGGTTVVDPDGKTAVIPPQQPELPSMPSPDEVAVQLNTDAAKSLKAAGSSKSAKAQAGFDATLKKILGPPTEPTVQPKQAAKAVESEVTLNRVEQINSKKQNLDQKAQQLGFANARALNLAKLTSTKVSDQEREVLEEYGNLNKEIKELSWKDAVNLPEADFDVWSKTRFTPEIKSDVDLNGMGQLYLTLSGRGETEKATQVLQKIQSSKRKANWTVAEWRQRFPDDATSQEELDSLNQQNQEWNDGIDSMLSILQEQTSPEVTPSLETEMPEKSSQTITGSNGEIAPAMPVQPQAGEAMAFPPAPSLQEGGSILERAIINNPPSVSPLIQPITPQENANLEITDQESLRQEPQDGVEGRKAEEAILGDSLLRSKEGKVKEEVDLKAGLPRQQPGEAPDIITWLKENYARKPIVFVPKAKRRKATAEAEALGILDELPLPVKRRLFSFDYGEGTNVANMDEIAGLAYEANLIPSSDPTVLAQSIIEAFKARKAGASLIKEGEQQMEAAEQRTIEFYKAASDRTAPLTLIPRRDLDIGDVVQVGEDKMRVTYEYDEDGYPTVLILTGPKFGEQRFDPNKLLKAEKLDTTNRVQATSEFVPEAELEGAIPEAAPVAAPTEAPQPSPNLPALIAVRDNTATPEQVQSLVEQGLVERVDGQNIITEAGVAAMPEDQRPKLTPAERAAEVEGMAVPVERDATKPEQIVYKPGATGETPVQAAPSAQSQRLALDEAKSQAVSALRDVMNAGRGRFTGRDITILVTPSARDDVMLQITRVRNIDQEPQGHQDIITEQDFNEILESEDDINVVLESVRPDIGQARRLGAFGIPKLRKPIKYKYRLRLRDVGIGTAPSGFIEANGRDVAYNRPLSQQEMDDFEISPVGAELLRPEAIIPQTTKAAAETQVKQPAPKKAKSAKLDESKAIAEYPDLETFFEREIFPSGKKGGWVLKEKRTGARLSSGKTKEEASADFRKILLWQQAWNEESPSVFEMVNKLIEDKSINAEKYSQNYKIKPSNEEWKSILEGKLSELRQDREDAIKRHRSVGSYPKTDFEDNFIAEVEARLAKLQPTAAEKPTPDSVAVEPGATRGVQAEPVGGSIPTVGKVSPETEISSRENLGPKAAAAKKKQAADDEAAKKRQEKQDNATKSSLNSVVGPQKKDAIQGTVTKADVEAAREALTNSGEIPNAYLTNVYESLEAFLADKANARLFPSAYARLQTEKNIEGLYENGQTLIFAKQIQVSNLDRNLAKMLGITPEQAAARRVIAHENGHKAISLFTLAEKRELRGYLMRAYSDEQIAKLVETYDEYADWRTNLESRFEALEELLMRDFEKMEKIPTGGVWDDIVQFLKRVWRRLTGQKGEPTLKNLKDVARLMRNAMKRPAVALGSFTLKDGGKVKLSFIGEKAIENLPEERRQFMRDSLETAKAMAAAGKSSEEIREVTGWFPGKYDGKMRWEVPDKGASVNKEYLKEFAKGERSSITLGRFLDHSALYEAYPEAIDLTVEYDESLTSQGAFQEDTIYFGPETTRVDNILLHEIQHWIQEKEGFASGGNPRQFGFTGIHANADKIAKLDRERLVLMSEFPRVAEIEKKMASGIDPTNEEWDYFEATINNEPRFKAIADKRAALIKTPLEAYKSLAGEIEARDVQARKDLTPEQRAATAPYSSENIAPEDAIVMFGGGGAQMSMAAPEMDAEYIAAVQRGDMATAQRMVDEAAKAANSDSSFVDAGETQTDKLRWMRDADTQIAFYKKQIASLPTDEQVELQYERDKASAAKFFKNPDSPTVDEIISAIQAGVSVPRGTLADAIRERDIERANGEKEIAKYEAQKLRAPKGGERTAFKTGQPTLTKVFHATPFGRLDSFDDDMLGGFTGAPSAKMAHFFAGSSLVAETYFADRGWALDQKGFFSLSAEQKKELVSAVREELGDSPSDQEVANLAEELFDTEYDASKIQNELHEVFVNLRNPLVHDFRGEGYRDVSFRELLEKAEADGHDGVVMANTYDAGPAAQLDDKGESTNIVAVLRGHTNQIKSADPVTYDDAGNVIPLSQRFQPESPDIRFSRPQFASDTDAATSAGNEAARSTIYSERDMDVREAIRRAYEAMPKDTSVAVPIGELFAKTEELMPGVTQDEFSNVLQDLFEDNGAVLQEGGQIIPEQEVEIQAFEKENPFNELIRKSSEKSPSLGEINGVSKKFVQRVLRPASSFATNNGIRIDDNAPLQARAMPDGSIIIGYSLSQERFDELQKMAPQAASQYTKDSVIEELIHLSDLIGLRNQWIKSGKKISFDQFVLGEQSNLAFSLIQKADSLNDLEAESLRRILASSLSLYNNNPEIANLSLNELLDLAAQYPYVLPELVRSLIQLKKTGQLTETAFRKIANVLREWQEIVLQWISDGYASAKEGVFGEMLSERIKNAENNLAQFSDTSEINVTTPEGRRAGFVVVMPRAAKASKIPIEDAEEASKSFKVDLAEAGKGRVDKTAKFKGKLLKDTEIPEHNVKSYVLYRDTAIKLIDDLMAKTNDILVVAEALQDPEFQIAVGLQVSKDVSSDMITIARSQIGIEIENRLANEIRKERNPRRKRELELAEKRGIIYYNAGTGAGQALQNRQESLTDPRYRGRNLFNQAKLQKEQKSKDKLDAITGGTEKITDIITKAEEKAAEETTQAEVEAQESAVEDDQDAALIREGEETLDNESKNLWGKAKMLIMRLAMYARADKSDVKTGSKASLTAEQRDELNAILRMPKAERDKARAKDEAELKAVLRKLIGEESEAKTPQQKKTRQKRVKMIDVVKKYAESGKSIDLADQQTALKGMLREMNKARPADSVPLERAMPWRKILSSNPKDVAEYRQRIFEAISDLPSFQNLTDEQKERLADLYAEAWENRRQAILDRMLRDEIKKARDRDEISEDVEKKLQQSRNKILEIVNLGGFNNDDLVKILGERYGISASFTEEQRERIQKLADQLQDEDMNTAKRNKLAMEFAVELAGAMDVPVSEIISNWWTSSVLFGPQTIFSIGAAFLNGGYSIATIGTRKMLAKLVKGDIQGAIEESILMLKGFARYLGAFKQSGRRAWSYLWTGDVGLLGTGSTDILSEINNFDQLQRFQRHKLLAEKLAKDPRMVRRYVGVYLRFVSRLLTALDAFNVMVTKAGTASLALRMSGMSTDKIIEAEKMLNLKAYKDQVIRDYFDNKAPKTQAEKALVDSYAEAEMYRAINKLGGKMENADYLASESAMTMQPTGFGGVVYDAITGFFAQRQSNADEYLEKMKKDWISNKDLKAVTFLALAYLRQFAAYNAAGLTGSKFVRYASNKFNQGLSFIPFAGLLRQLEAKDDKIKGKDAFRETIYRNQIVSFVMLMVGYSVIKAIQDEPDDEERGNFWNGGWSNLTPDQKKQMLAKGQKEYTMGFKFNGRWYVFNYQNWPLNQILSAIGSMSDQIRFSPEKWDEKSALSKGVAGMVSGVKSTLEIPALSGLQELVGNRLASKDPTEKELDRLSRVASGWVGGFVPRILKDIDFYTQPELRKYEGLWEKTASHIPIYRRYIGEEYYDILGKQIKRNVIPGSREFMMGPTEPEYKILGALNARNIFLTPANAEYRMIGKGRNRRRLTQEEADAYSLETGRGYRDMLLRYGQRALQMPTERARAFLQDKAEEVRDRALKRAYRR